MPSFFATGFTRIFILNPSGVLIHLSFSILRVSPRAIHIEPFQGSDTFVVFFSQFYRGAIHILDFRGNAPIHHSLLTINYSYFKLSYTTCNTSLHTSILSDGTLIKASFNVSSANDMVSSCNF